MSCLCEILQTFGCSDWTDDVTYFGDGFIVRHVRPQSRVANDNKLVVVAKSNAVHVGIWDDVRVEIRAAE